MNKNEGMLEAGRPSVFADLCSSRHQMAGATVVSASASTIRRTWPKETVRAAANRRKWLAMVALQNDQGRRSTQPTVDSRLNCKSGDASHEQRRADHLVAAAT